MKSHLGILFLILSLFSFNIKAEEVTAATQEDSNVSAPEGDKSESKAEGFGEAEVKGPEVLSDENAEKDLTENEPSAETLSSDQGEVEAEQSRPNDFVPQEVVDGAKFASVYAAYKEKIFSAVKKKNSKDKKASSDTKADAKKEAQKIDPEIYKEFLEESRFLAKEASIYNENLKRLITSNFEETRFTIEEKFNKNQGRAEENDDFLREKLVKDLEAFVKRYPRNKKFTPKSLFRLGELYFEQSKIEYNKLEEAYTKQLVLFDSGKIKVEPEAPEESFKKTIKVHSLLVKRFPSHEDAFKAQYVLAFCHYLEGNFDKAARAWEKYLKMYPDTPLSTEIAYRLADYYFEEGTGDEMSVKAPQLYKEATKDKSNNIIYPNALYKLAWTFYRLDKYEESIDHFLKVLDWSYKNDNENLVPESVQYIGIIFADENKPENLDFYNFMEGQKKNPYADQMASAYAKLMMENSFYQKAADAYELALQLNPLREDGPELQSKIIGAYVSLAKEDQKINAQKNMVARFGEGSPWHKKYINRYELRKKAEQISRNSIYELAVYHHKLAQAFKKENDAINAAKEYTLAAENYNNFLSLYPYDKDSYTLRFYLADALFYSGNFDRAGWEFSLIRDHKYQGDFRSDASFKAMNSYKQVWENEIKEQKIAKHEPQAVFEYEGKEFEPHDIAISALKYLYALDRFVTMNPKNDQLAAVSYNAMKLFYTHLYFDIARERGLKILENHPENKVAEYAMDLIVNTYTVEQNFEKVLELAQNYSKKDIVKNNPSLKKKFDGLIIGARLTLASRAFEKEDFETAAKGFTFVIDNIKESRDDMDKIIYNAAVSYEKTQRFETAMVYLKRLVDEYPKSQLAEVTLYKLATNNEKRFNFDESLRQYQKFLKRYPKSENIPVIIYNAGVLSYALQKYRLSSNYFVRYAKRYPEKGDAVKTYFRSCMNYKRAKKWRESIQSFYDFIKFYRKDPKNNDAVIEAYVQLADIYKTLKRPKQEAKIYETILKIYKDKINDTSTLAAYYAAKAEFANAEKVFNRYKRIKISGNMKQQAKAIEKKKNMVTDVSKAYDVVVAYQQPEWTIASIFRRGSIQQEFANSLFDAPTPRGLDEESAEIYLEELEEFAIPLEDAAIEEYQKVLEFAEKTKLNTEQVEQAKIELSRLRPSEYSLDKELMTEKISDQKPFEPFLVTLETEGIFSPGQFVEKEPKLDDEESAEESESKSEADETASSDDSSTEATEGQEEAATNAEESGFGDNSESNETSKQTQEESTNTDDQGNESEPEKVPSQEAAPESSEPEEGGFDSN